MAPVDGDRAPTKAGGISLEAELSPIRGQIESHGNIIAEMSQRIRQLEKSFMEMEVGLGNVVKLTDMMIATIEGQQGDQANAESKRSAVVGEPGSNCALPGELYGVCGDVDGE